MILMKKLKVVFSVLMAVLLLAACFVPAVSAADEEECKHIFVFTVVTPADGCKDGVGVYKCTRCGDTQGEPVIVAGDGNHDWGPASVAPYPCALATGTHTCLHCGRTEACTIYPTAEHDWQITVTSAPDRCISGTGYKTCAVCGEQTYIVIPGGEHTWEWVIDSPATEYNPGTKHQVCTVCGAVQNMNTKIPADKSSGGFADAILRWIDSIGSFFGNFFAQIRDLFGGIQF
jgi:hypothetical protein